MYPTCSDLKLTRVQRSILTGMGTWRYRLGVYGMPYELAVAQRLFRYRQPEIEGF
jgi:hypothetical protein